MAGAVLWDFDGTLALRPLEWRGVLMEVLDEQLPGHGIGIEQVRRHLHDGFPWHAAHTGHPHLADPDEWWTALLPVLTRAYAENGVPAAHAERLARLVRARYVDPARGWALVDGAVATLSRFAAAGWKQAVLSNHVPELPALVAALGIGDRLEAVLTSAATGWEKPHPRMFALGRAAVGDVDEVWMVGDNPEADVAGAEAAGLRALLVQNPGRARHDGALTLPQVADRLLGPAAGAAGG